MKNECSIVRDVLPLYFENMVREETAAFVREHLSDSFRAMNILQKKLRATLFSKP